MGEIKPDISVDITGLKCPIPLIKTRRAVIKANKGEYIELIGTPNEEVSRKEILIAIESLKQKLISNQDMNSDKWQIIIQKATEK